MLRTGGVSGLRLRASILSSPPQSSPGTAVYYLIHEGRALGGIFTQECVAFVTEIRLILSGWTEDSDSLNPLNLQAHNASRLAFETFRKLPKSLQQGAEVFRALHCPIVAPCGMAPLFVGLIPVNPGEIALSRLAPSPLLSFS